MGRLIDESEAIELIKGSDELTDYQKDESITCIRACNTAYDPDKVLKRLEEVLSLAEIQLKDMQQVYLMHLKL